MTTTHSPNEPVDILLVEDNPADEYLIIDLFKQAKMRTRVSVAHDGVEALDYLHRTYGAAPTASPPCLILLDLNLPKKNGLEVLAEIKNDENLKQIPVVILSGSAEQRDILQSYRLHANCYLSKPLNMAELAEVILEFKAFWFTVAKLPP